MKSHYIIACCIMLLYLFSCHRGQEYDLDNATEYENNKSALALMEKKNAEKFLVVTTSTKRNFFGQTVVKGKIYNKAKILTYKDVELQLSFYSKTKALLEVDKEIIYEEVHPGG